MMLSFSLGACHRYPKEAHLSGVREISRYDPKPKLIGKLCIHLNLPLRNIAILRQWSSNSPKSTEARVIIKAANIQFL